MFGARGAVRRRSKDEAEKPFWISFADLMSALMVLFLVVMSVALSSITKKLTDQEVKQASHAEKIRIVMNAFHAAADSFNGLHPAADSTDFVRVYSDSNVINFGSRAQFSFNSSLLNSSQEQLLREFVPKILRIADQEGKEVLKRMVVEGFTDRQGTYLGNLDLSLDRSQRVLCALFAAPLLGEQPLSVAQLVRIRTLFMVGGYSFNSTKNTPAESRRVEMRIEFYGIEKDSVRESTPSGNFGTCAVGSR